MRPRAVVYSNKLRSWRQARKPIAPSKIVSVILRMSSARRLRVNFSLSFVVSSSVNLGVVRPASLFLRLFDASLRGSLSRYDGVSNGLAVPEPLETFRPFLGLLGGAGSRRRVVLFSSSASVPLSLGDVDSFRLFRWSTSKYEGPSVLANWLEDFKRRRKLACDNVPVMPSSWEELPWSLWYGCGERDIRVSCGGMFSLTLTFNSAASSQGMSSTGVG